MSKPRLVVVAACVCALAWGCESSQAARPAAEPSTTPAAVMVAAQTPSAAVPSDEPDEPATAPGPPAQRIGPSTGIATCDAYLGLYEACERRLRGEIEAGNRRAPEAERAWLLYILSTPERPTVEQGCLDMLMVLQEQCH